MTCVEQPGSDSDFVMGRPGALTAVASLLEEVPGHGFDVESLVAHGAELAIAIDRSVDGGPDLAPGYLGFAHGLAGQLYALLRWAEVTGSDATVRLPSHLELLRGLKVLAPNGSAYWPFAQGDNAPPWPGWCHGSAGYVHLWSQAAAVLGDEYLDEVEAAALAAWSHPQHAKLDLCCGLAGRAYSLLAAYQVTGDARWIERAGDLADIAVNANPVASFARPDSLFAGRVGLALLVNDLADPSSAFLPPLRSGPLRRTPAETKPN